MHCQTRVTLPQFPLNSRLRNWLGLRSAEGGMRWTRTALASLLVPLSLATPGWGADASDRLVRSLSYKPRQADVNYEMVEADKVSECELDETARDDGKGFWVTGPNGQPLRWFADTNGDNRLDRWCYYNSGVEIYRESDTNTNGTADEYRWLSTEGMRWGLDKNEDGSIDSWKMISAEEVTAEVVRAAAQRDKSKFARLLITEAEIDALGVGKEKAAALRQHATDAAEQFEAWASGQNVVSSQSKWTNFGADKPGVVPAGTEGSEKDVVVYENVVALMDDGGKARQLLVGTIIQVGDVWRLVDLPRAVNEGAVVSDASIFFPATFTPRGGSGATSEEEAGGISKVMQKLVTDLQEVDAKLQAGGDTAALQADRADVLEKLVSAAENDKERTQWIKQFADTVSAAAQTGDYPEGAERLNDFAQKISSIEPTPDDIAYVLFRALTAAHNQKMQDPKADFEALQKSYLEDLQAFVSKFGSSPDAAEAMIQIALSEEFSGETKAAQQWYTKASANFGDTQAGKKATGAIARLNLVGQKFGLASPTLDGRKFSSDALRDGPVVYHCWASWCEGCKAEMRALNELKSKYAKTKFQVVGINFDNTADVAQQFVRDNRYEWIQLHDQGGLESELAVSYGILTLPFNVVVDKTGKVVKTGVHWTELDGIIEELTK